MAMYLLLGIIIVKVDFTTNARGLFLENKILVNLQNWCINASCTAVVFSQNITKRWAIISIWSAFKGCSIWTINLKHWNGFVIRFVVWKGNELLAGFTLVLRAKRNRLKHLGLLCHRYRFCHLNWLSHSHAISLSLAMDDKVTNVTNIWWLFANRLGFRGYDLGEIKFHLRLMIGLASILFEVT